MNNMLLFFLPFIIFFILVAITLIFTIFFERISTYIHINNVYKKYIKRSDKHD